MASTTTATTSTRLTTGPLTNGAAVLENPALSSNGINQLPPLKTGIYSPTDLLTQPWLPDLTRVVNESYAVQIDNVKVVNIRLHSDSQISEEIGENGFTVVAFACGEDPEKVEVVGTASVKAWRDDGLWMTYDANDANESDHANEDTSNSKKRQPFICNGDYELALVAISPAAKYRRRGIAEYLAKLCEQETLRRHYVRESESYRKTSIRMMVRVKKDLMGAYWSRKGYNTVGTRWCPKGMWQSTYEFDMWAMLKELSIKERTDR